MKLVACVDTNWAIGNKGNLLFRIPEDMEFFRKLTKNGFEYQNMFDYVCKEVEEYFNSQSKFILSIINKIVYEQLTK